MQEGQEKNDGNQIIFGGFSKFVTQRSFVQSFGGFFLIIEANKPHPFIYNNINWSLGLFYTGYMRYNYDETSVSHTKNISTLLGLDFNGLKPLLNKLLVNLGDGIQASRARCHLKKKI